MFITRRVLLFSLVVVSGAATAHAQRLGYVVGGPGAVRGFFGPLSAFHLGGGAEVPVADRLSAGGELGLFGNESSVLWLFSGNAVVDLSPAPGHGRLAPFVSGGVAHMGSGEGGFNAWTVGGGVNLRFAQRPRLRLDVRTRVRPDVRGAVQYWTFDVGAVFPFN